jgi:hypothetical protein
LYDHLSKRKSISKKRKKQSNCKILNNKYF